MRGMSCVSVRDSPEKWEMWWEEEKRGSQARIPWGRLQEEVKSGHSSIFPQAAWNCFDSVVTTGRRGDPSSSSRMSEREELHVMWEGSLEFASRLLLQTTFPRPDCPSRVHPTSSRRRSAEGGLFAVFAHFRRESLAPLWKLTRRVAVDDSAVEG